MKGQGDNVLLDLECRVEHLLIQHEIPEEKAGRVAEKVADGVREHWGGQQVYFTQKMHKVTASRDKQIFEEFDGGNIQELNVN